MSRISIMVCVIIIIPSLLGCRIGGTVYQSVPDTFNDAAVIVDQLGERPDPITVETELEPLYERLQNAILQMEIEPSEEHCRLPRLLPRVDGVLGLAKGINEGRWQEDTYGDALQMGVARLREYLNECRIEGDDSG